ncbi:hypothetical protein NEMIN01_1889 [Nematocida minor]|uniref:uncharacterized protein n=1 Tax=Nematocida minor TaxID=1912983 RepID=UPI00221E988D|nr:uncharacterized protein NEMIN01_1889 [Nematocida minor]KAI5192220.1 hypothetical protein NEMIN01_1889 [Nematocida minor]
MLDQLITYSRIMKRLVLYFDDAWSFAECYKIKKASNLLKKSIKNNFPHNIEKILNDREFYRLDILTEKALPLFSKKLYSEIDKKIDYYEDMARKGEIATDEIISNIRMFQIYAHDIWISETNRKNEERVLLDDDFTIEDVEIIERTNEYLKDSVFSDLKIMNEYALRESVHKHKS